MRAPESWCVRRRRAAAAAVTRLAVARRVPAQPIKVALIRKAPVAVHDERHMARHRPRAQQQREQAREQRGQSRAAAAAQHVCLLEPCAVCVCG